MGMRLKPFVQHGFVTPLAAILRPISIVDVIGQDHLTASNKPLGRMVLTSRIPSTILWGPPGTGKTSIVRALAHDTNARFAPLNATSTTVKDLRAVIDSARRALELETPQRTLVFVDEIHRWTKSQQDVLLPEVEDGVILLWGATTEKPQFAVNSTILSRCLILETKPLSKKHLAALAIKVRAHYSHKGRTFKIDEPTCHLLFDRCSGDARKLVTALEAAVEVMSDDGVVTRDIIDAVIPTKSLVFDARGNEHFDLAHCYQEAIQHSDTDGAIYWLAKWIESGEDPAYIARRMLITAAEDCAGNPFAMTTAMAAAFITERTGLPECLIPMALATCEMGQSERNKSAYYAIKEAMFDVQHGETVHVPPELRAGTFGYMKSIAKTYLKGWRRDAQTVERPQPQSQVDDEEPAY